jgi:S1-C subfamily serine protease
MIGVDQHNRQPWSAGAPARSVTITWRQLLGTLVGSVTVGSLVVSLALLWALGAGPFARVGRFASFGVVTAAVPSAATAASPPAGVAVMSPGSVIAPVPASDPFAVVVAVAARVTPAVVTIMSTQASYGFGGQATSVGSGVIVDARGWILTNDHVVAGSSGLSVALADGRMFDGTIVSEDASLDLAMVRIAASGLPAASLGRSTNLHVGQLVIAIGSPLGIYPDSVTDGILSAIGRSIDVGTRRQQKPLSNLLQTDAPINPGNSGGPLLDAAGSVIGINTATDSSAQGIGFAIPIDVARPIIDAALAGGT